MQRSDRLQRPEYNIERKNTGVFPQTQSHTISKSAAISAYKSDGENGLSEAEARRRINELGKNKLSEKKTKNILFRFFEQFTDFMIIILLAAAAISFLTALYEKKYEDFLDPVIILVIIIINAITGVVQEYKAEKAINSLKNLSVSESIVVRNGKKIKILSENIVPGDLILLEAGDSVPADARIISSASLFADESSLTGESVPSEKNEDKIYEINTPVGDRKNMLYMSTLVTQGKCSAIVTETGMNTEVGKIAKLLTEDGESETPLQKKLSHTGKILAITALSICAFIFILGIIQKIPFLEMFMLSISLAVAAMPEGLPAIVTIVLAIGVQRMAKNKAVIRKLSAVETLGGATVICSDKTGTLTQNKMTVTNIYTSEGKEYGEKEMGKTIAEDLKNLLTLMTLCNNTAALKSGKNIKYSGDPTETALVEAADKINVSKEDSDKFYRKAYEYPFDSGRKLMTTVHSGFGSGCRVITKGAPDILLAKCAYYKDGSGVKRLTEKKRSEFLSAVEKMSDMALRVLAAAYKDVESSTAFSRIAAKEIETDLIFCGFTGMIDPPRKEVIEAVRKCKTAGIRAVMITGDHIATAKTIAKQLGIYSDGDKIISGQELYEMSDEELAENIYSYSVFARVSPEHKVRIVKAFKSRGNIVAMTGDGVNDAPSLKAADIGCAMGKSGTDVARDSADMILLDDNFSTIVEAVKEGRNIYDNIKKAIHFLLSSNFGEIITILSVFLMRLPTPLLAIHLLWVNFVTDSLPALALSAEKPGDDIMRQPPKNTSGSLFSGGLGVRIVLEGFMIGSLTVLAYIIGYRFFDMEGDPFIGRTMAFLTLSISQLVHAYNMRSEKSLFKVGFFKNKRMNLAFIVCLFLQVSVVIIDPLANIFKTAELNVDQWLIVAALSLAPLAIIEMQKFVSRK